MNGKNAVFLVRVAEIRKVSGFVFDGDGTRLP